VFDLNQGLAYHICICLLYNLFYINVKESRKGNQKWTIQRNWQYRVHKSKKNKIKTQHITCWTSLFANKHK